MYALVTNSQCKSEKERVDQIFHGVSGENQKQKQHKLCTKECIFKNVSDLSHTLVNVLLFDLFLFDGAL